MNPSREGANKENIPIFLFLIFDPQGLSLGWSSNWSQRLKDPGLILLGPGARQRRVERMDLGVKLTFVPPRSLLGLWIQVYIHSSVSFICPFSHAEHTHSNNRCNHCWDRQQLAIDFERPAGSQWPWMCKTLFLNAETERKLAKKQIQFQTTLSE